MCDVYTLPDFTVRVRRSLRRKLRFILENGGKCCYCDRSLHEDLDTVLLASVDHLVPLAAGKPNHARGPNVKLSCMACNLLKSSASAYSIDHARRIIQQRRTLCKFWLAIVTAEQQCLLPAPVSREAER
jgi:5-methylcytosine-specific restriction endonuclease McrA